ncbi:hypothetical protein FACS189449_04970 [Alphaproteobacteria bacterium]|nr:hypothetical protein FACS189449_04970 [Alphaproteobacteria bacterium]
MNKTMSAIKGAIYALLFMTTASLFASILDTRGDETTHVHFDILKVDNTLRWNLSVLPDPSKGLMAHADTAQYSTHSSGSDNLNVDTISLNDSGDYGTINIDELDFHNTPFLTVDGSLVEKYVFNILTYDTDNGDHLPDVQTTHKYVTGINDGQVSDLVFSSDAPPEGQPYYSIEIERDTTRVHDERKVRDFLVLTRSEPLLPPLTPSPAREYNDHQSGASI